MTCLIHKIKKNISVENQAQTKYKYYRNIFKKTLKKKWLEKYMERDKEIFNSLKGSSNKNLSSIIDNGRCITKPQKIPKAFNKYFDRIAVNN